LIGANTGAPTSIGYSIPACLAGSVSSILIKAPAYP